MSELYHYGIKGMHWGVRRFQNADGSLTAAGIKRYGIKGYSKDAYNSNKTMTGKVYDRITNAHKSAGRIRYSLSTENERKQRAESYLNEQHRKPSGRKEISEQTKKKVKNVANTAKDPRNYSRTAVAVLPAKKGQRHSNLVWLGNGASAYFGSQAISEVARWSARRLGQYKVERMIAVGTPYVQAAIVGGTAGKIMANNYRDRKEAYRQTQKLMRGR